MAPRYELRIAHKLDATMAADFEGLELCAEGDATVVRGDLDQAALHGLLERVRVLHLDVIELRRLGASTVPDS